MIFIFYPPFSGVFHGGEPTLIVGGRAIVCPCIQTIQRLPLSTITLLVQSPKVYTSQGVAISVTGVAQVCTYIAKKFVKLQHELISQNFKELISRNFQKNNSMLQFHQKFIPVKV